MRSRRVICLVPEGGIPPDSLEGYTPADMALVAPPEECIEAARRIRSYVTSL